MKIPNKINIIESPSESFFDAFDFSRRDPRLDDFPFMSVMWPTVYMWLAYPILHVLPRTEEQCRKSTVVSLYNQLDKRLVRPIV